MEMCCPATSSRSSIEAIKGTQEFSEVTTSSSRKMWTLPSGCNQSLFLLPCPLHKVLPPEGFSVGCPSDIDLHIQLGALLEPGRGRDGVSVPPCLLPHQPFTFTRIAHLTAQTLANFLPEGFMVFQTGIKTEVKEILKFQQLGLFPSVSSAPQKHISRFKPSQRKVPACTLTLTHAYKLPSTTISKQMSVDAREKGKNI